MHHKKLNKTPRNKILRIFVLFYMKEMSRILNKVLLYIVFVILSTLPGFAESVKGKVTGAKEEPLTGVLIHWKNTSIAVSSDENGLFLIPVSTESKELQISYVGYTPQIILVNDTSEFLNIHMKENHTLEEIVVSERRMGTISSRQAVIQTQRLNSAEFIRAACCNLSESFETNPSVDVSYSDATTGAKQIKLLGLSGTYVQMLTENFPNFRGLASTYGLDYVPGPWMESIQISKGTSSVKNGYEAITGQINVEYKKPPTSDIASANVFFADNQRYEVNADGSYLINPNLSTGLLVHYSNEEKEFDMNHDGFIDTPLKHQFNIMNRWHYQNNKMISQSGIKFLTEGRRGGQTENTSTEPEASLYTTDMSSNRIELFSKNGFFLNPERNESAAFIVSGTYQDQKSSFGIRPYNGKETNLYANLMYETNLKTPMHRISTGLSVNYDYFNETYNLFYFNPNIVYSDFHYPANTTEKTKETTTGAYLEYTFNKDDKLIILAGLRADYSSMHDFFVTPRLHLKYNFTDWMHLRASAGKGYRTAHVLPENSFYLASSRIFKIEENLDQEEAWNYSLNLSFYIPIAGKELTINGEWYYTDFQKQVVIDVDSDPHAVSFYNLNGKSYSSNFQIEATYPFFRGFTLTAAYRAMDAQTTYQGVLKKRPLTGNYKGLITASYQTPLRKWQFDFTSQFNGGGRMPDPDKTNPLWNQTFGSYTILNAQISKFFKTWSVYIGAENILDYTQEHPIIAAEKPWGADFDATMIWGPLHGRKIYIGARWNLPRL